jgi:hypothetical protein
MYKYNSYSINFAQPSPPLFVFGRFTAETNLQILCSFLGMMIDYTTSGIIDVILNASSERRPLILPFLDRNIYMIVNFLGNGTQEPVAT